jgi:hypothetical protein
MCVNTFCGCRYGDIMSTTPDLTTLTPSEIDKLWAQALIPAIRTENELSGYQRQIRRYERASGYKVPDHLTDAVEELTAKLYEQMKVSEPFDAEFDRRGGWNRYLLVANKGGHFHRRGYCPSIQPTTLVSPVWELSGSDDTTVVATHGTQACTRCFPDAPVETRETRERLSAEKKRIKDAEKEQKRQKALVGKVKRARTLMAKVDKAYETLGGLDALVKLPQTGPESPYAVVGALNLQVTVEDTILDDVKECHGERRWHTDPRLIIAEAENLGL